MTFYFPNFPFVTHVDVSEYHVTLTIVSNLKQVIVAKKSLYLQLYILILTGAQANTFV